MTSKAELQRKTVARAQFTENTLITIDVPTNQLNTGNDAERGFVFLSDEYQNGDKLERASDDFAGESFFLTEVFVEDNAYLTMNTFAEVERGTTWRLTDYSTDAETPNVGGATLTFANGDAGA